MNYLNYIKNKWNNHIGFTIHVLLLLLGVYIFLIVEDHYLWKVPVIFVGLLSWFLLGQKTKHPIIWITFFILLLIDLFHSYFWVANHHFMMLLMVLSVILYMYHNRKDFLLKNIQLLLVVVVMTSTFQKLTSSQFMSGDFYYFMINSGSLFRFFINFFPESLEVVHANRESLSTLRATNPNLAQSIVFKDVVPDLGTISLVYAWITIAIEFLVAFSVLLKPKNVLTHLLLVVMIIGILCARFETGFMGLLAICGLFLCDNLKLRFLYAAIIVACVALMITKIGYH